MRTVGWFVLVALAAPDARAEKPAAAVSAATAIRVAGELNDAVWQGAEPITQFLQRDPKEGAEPSFKTEARVAYDATALYVAVQAFDPEPQRIVGIRTRRDDYFFMVRSRAGSNPFHDRRSGYE